MKLCKHLHSKTALSALVALNKVSVAGSHAIVLKLKSVRKNDYLKFKCGQVHFSWEFRYW